MHVSRYDTDSHISGVPVSEIIMTQLQAVATLTRPIVFLRGVVPAPQALALFGGRALLPTLARTRKEGMSACQLQLKWPHSYPRCPNPKYDRHRRSRDPHHAQELADCTHRRSESSTRQCWTYWVNSFRPSQLPESFQKATKLFWARQVYTRMIS